MRRSDSTAEHTTYDRSRALEKTRILISAGSEYSISMRV